MLRSLPTLDELSIIRNVVYTLLPDGFNALELIFSNVRDNAVFRQLSLIFYSLFILPTK
jgi:hypothetical protein